MKSRRALLSGLAVALAGMLSTLTVAHVDPNLVQGYVVGKRNAPIVGAKVFTYRFTGQNSRTVGSSHPMGAGFFSPPGSEDAGWYLFNVHMKDNRDVSTAPVYVGETTGPLVIPTNGSFPYPKSSNDVELPFEGRYLVGGAYCGYEELPDNDPNVSPVSGPEMVAGYIVDRNMGSPISGATVYPYRKVGEYAVTVGDDFPLGAGYFAPPGDEEEGWYIFDVLLPNGAGNIRTAPIFIGLGAGTVVLPIDGRKPFFGTPRTPSIPPENVIPFKNGFTLGVSYYGAGCGTEAQIADDFQKLADLNITGPHRIWVTWKRPNATCTSVDSNGNIIESAFSKIRFAVKTAWELGMTIDLTFQSSDFSSLTAHKNAVRAVTSALKEYPNWLIDVGNEAEGDLSSTAVRDLIATVKSVDPTRVATVSFSGAVQSIVDNYVGALKAGASLNVLAPHFERNNSWSDQIGNRMDKLIEELVRAGVKVPPLYLQEEARNNYNGQFWTYDQFVQAARTVKVSGGLSFTFHTGAMFDATKGGIFSQFDSVETRVINNLSTEAGLEN